MNDLKKKTENYISKAQALLYLCDQYDLLEGVDSRWDDRWDNIYYYSSKINNLANNVEIYHACTCCSDAILIARPYIVVNGINLFSNPPTFNIGEGHDDCNICYGNWQNQFKEFNPIIIEIIQKYFDKSPFPGGSGDE